MYLKDIQVYEESDKYKTVISNLHYKVDIFEF